MTVTHYDALRMARDPKAREGLSTRSTSEQRRRIPTARFEIRCAYVGPTDDRGFCPECGVSTHAMWVTRKVAQPHKPDRTGSLGWITWWESLGTVRLDLPGGVT